MTKRITKRDVIYGAVILVLILAAAIMTVLYCTKKNDCFEDMSYYDKKCAVFEAENPNFAHGQIVFIGDSITDGCALDNYYSDLSLATYNRGIGGDVTSGVLDRLDSSVFALEPSKVVLMIGINDINGGRSINYVLENYEKILKLISEELPDTEVYCMSILPLNEQLEEYTVINVESSTEKILEINSRIEELVARYGYEFVNLYPLFDNGSNRLYKEMSPDGIHLNHAGYTVWSQKLKPLLLD